MKAITFTATSKVKNAIKEFLTFSLILALFCVASAIAPHEAHAKGPAVKPIPELGSSADGKYPAYNLDGDLDDMWYTSGNIKYKPEDLVGRLPYIELKDVNKNNYRCEWICKDMYENVVGLNPKIKAMFKK